MLVIVAVIVTVLVTVTVAVLVMVAQRIGTEIVARISPDRVDVIGPALGVVVFSEQ